MAYKRKRVYAPKKSWAAKKRRTGYRKKRSYGGGRSTTLTTQTGAGRTFGFKGKKISKKSWNSMLWKNSLQKSHYRSAWAITFNYPTLASPAVSDVRYLSADDNTAAPFWQAAGGALGEDSGVLAPGFAGDIIFRGGTLGLIIGNTNDAVDFDNIRAEVYLIKTGERFDGAAIPATVALGWDPSLIQDFKSRVGRIIKRWDFLIDNNNSVEIKYRKPIQKHDQGEYVNGFHRYFWFILASNASGAATPTTVQVTRYMNASFSGDAI